MPFKIFHEITREIDDREFDEGLLQRIPEISYEDDIKDIPSPPDVGNYLVSEVNHDSFFLFCNIYGVINYFWYCYFSPCPVLNLLCLSG